MAEKSPPLDELQWRAPEWIQAFGLRTDNVLDYFSQSPFYDRSSNNQVLKMQSQFNQTLQFRHDDLAASLSTMRGIEFVIALASPQTSLWIVRKQNRLSPHETIPLATYYVINENIYMAPTVYSVVSSRILSAVTDLRQALKLAVEDMPHFSPTMGYSYVPFSEEDPGVERLRAEEGMMGRALGMAVKAGTDAGAYLDDDERRPAGATPAGTPAAEKRAAVPAAKLARRKKPKDK
ncbi:MED6 mediator subfamily complex component-domain-containing protein [Dipodascopsis tothii]|uniref:MED6 mediator subfamily complex component-domain-containing protein n=1 Tax=Dipodascopsis tothii TaxID=44089 RepID=UPI0034CE9809